MNLRLPSLPDKDTLSNFISDIFRNLLVIYLLLLVFSFISPGYVEFYFDMNDFIYPMIVLGATSLLFYAQRLEKSNKIKFDTVKKWIFYAFQGLLLIVALQSITSLSLPDVGKTLLMFVAVLLGVVTFCLNMERSGVEAKLEKKQEDIAERKREDEFDRKFSILTRFNLDYGISENWNRRDYVALIFAGLIAPFVWIVRLPYNFVKWMYKEEWFYSTSLLLVILLGIYLRIYNLGTLSLTTDEIYQGIAMKSILENGAPSLPDGGYYNRGFTHSYLSSFFALFFGANEFSVRFPSAIAGLGIIVILYFLGKEIQTKKVGLMLSFIICIFPWTIEFSRWGRMYSMVTFLILFTFYSSMIGFKYKNKKFVILAIISAFFAIMTQEYGYITPLIILIATILYTFEFKKEMLTMKYLFIIALLVLLKPLVNIIVNVRKNNFTFEKIYSIIIGSYGFLTSISFSDFFINHLLSNYVFLFIGIIYFFYCIVGRKINIKDNVFLFVTATLALILLSYFNLQDTTRYLFFIMPLFITIAIIGYKELLYTILNKYVDNYKTSILLMSTLIMITVISIAPLNYSISIPSRAHGDTYENPYYAPTTVSDYIADWKNNNIYIKNNNNNNATIISNGFLFTYYYNKEPDYYLRPGRSNYFSRKIGNDSYMKYMNKTILIYEKEQFFHIINETDNAIYIAFNSRGGQLDYTIVAEKWINEVDKNGKKFKLVFIGDEPNSKVYKLE